MSTRADATPATAPLPRPSVLLLAGAVLHLVILVATRTAMNANLDLSPPAVITYLTGAMPLVLAASLVAGWDRWPAGRRWLVAAAMAYAVVALLDVVGALATAIAWPPDPADPNPAPSRLRIALLVTASLAAPLLAAAGLWRGAVAAPRVALIATGAVVGLLVLGTLVLGVLPAFGDVFDEPFLAPIAMGSELVPGAVAVLGIAAVRAVPRRYVVPEVLVAVGALASALGLTAVSAVVSRATWAPWIEPVSMLSLTVGLAGLASVALGFFTARISAPGEP